jgi:hypothetical protein
VWLGERTWATHGHYLDRHLVPESTFGLPRGRLRTPPRRTVGPIEYERVQRRGRRAGRRARESLAERLMSRPVATLLESGAELARLATMPHLPHLMMRTGMAPVSARLLDAQMRHAAIPAMAHVVRRLGIDADWVLFGHVHRRGPIAGEPWPAPGGVRFLNTGAWVYEPLLVDRAGPPHPYWPGGAVVLQDGHAPRSVGLLDGIGAEELIPPERTSPPEADFASRG